jgi:hypothetical protein
MALESTNHPQSDNFCHSVAIYYQSTPLSVCVFLETTKRTQAEK